MSVFKHGGGKKVLLPTAALVIADQIIKLIIARFFMDAGVVILPRVFRFQPVINTKLSWIGSMSGVKTPIVFLVLAQVFAVVFLVCVFRYMANRFDGGRKYAISALSVALAGVCCSFIDAVFWGGSLDYILLFSWFTFDLKDLYLTTIPVIIMLIYMIKNPAKQSG